GFYIAIDVKPAFILFHEAAAFVQPRRGATTDAIARDELHFRGGLARRASIDDLQPQPLLPRLKFDGLRPPRVMPRGEQISLVAHHKSRVTRSHQRVRIGCRFPAVPASAAALVSQTRL